MKLALHWQILIAILFATIIGSSIDQHYTVFGVHLYEVFTFIGTLFINALKMLIVPLVTASIICGVAGLGDSKHLGRLGGKTLGFYLISSLLAILVGLLVVNIIQPGYIDGHSAQQALSLGANNEVASQLAKIEGRGAQDVVEIFIRMIPPNIVKAAAEGQMLGLIMFSILFGVFMARTDSQYSKPLLNFWQGIQSIMMQMTMFVMKFSPIGVFGLVAKTVMVTGFGVLLNMGWFVVAVVLALAIHMFVTMALILKFVAKVNPIKHYKVMIEALVTAFSTASSAATLPVTMECLEKNAGVSKQTSSFVLPLGATVNMDGTALYECVAAMFIAQVYGLDLSIGVQFTIVTIALLTSIGVAGIPSASLIAITVILAAIGLPLEGIGLLLVTDRILDMLRTAVNIFGDSCCAVVIARTEGEKTNLV